MLSWSARSRSRRATWQHCEMVAGSPGSRSNTTRSGAAGLVLLPQPPHGRMELDRRQVHEPHQCGELVDNDELRGVAVAGLFSGFPHRLVALAGQRDRRDPVRSMVGDVLFDETFVVDTLGEPLHCQRPVGEMRKHDRCDARVVVEHVALGESGAIKRLVQIGELQLAVPYPYRHPLALRTHVAPLPGPCRPGGPAMRDGASGRLWSTH